MQKIGLKPTEVKRIVDLYHAVMLKDIIANYCIDPEDEEERCPLGQCKTCGICEEEKEDEDEEE